MIKVGIIGCEGLRATELVRILLNHPDVELLWVDDAVHGGIPLDRLVPGIVGETSLTVSTEGDLANVDLVYLCAPREQVETWLKRNQLPQELKVIDLSGSHNLDEGGDSPWAYGMSEMQRRVLVHDAQWVTIPGAAASASLLTLMPMARNSLLDSPLSLHVSLGSAVLRDNGMADGVLPQNKWIREQEQEVQRALIHCQESFSHPVTMTVDPNSSQRLLTVQAHFKTPMVQEMLNSVYRQYYEDHSFVFLLDRPVFPADVENTNKCLITLVKDESCGEATVSAVMDGLLKTAAGNAVHVMNLLFGLHERVGLSLKASGC